MSNGMQVVESVACREVVGLATRLPKPSRHRSMRLRKKIGKRNLFTSWEPTAYVVGDVIYAHPIIADSLRKRRSAP